MPPRSEIGLLGAVAGLILTLDLASKAAAVTLLGSRQPATRVELVADWIRLEYSENRGAAFGVLAGFGSLLAISSIAIVVGLLVCFLQTERPVIGLTIAVGAIAGGALGNLIDRIRQGYVVDFISIGPWPNFNVADSAITIGLLTLAWGMIQSGRGEGNLLPGPVVIDE